MYIITDDFRTTGVKVCSVMGNLITTPAHVNSNKNAISRARIPALLQIQLRFAERVLKFSSREGEHSVNFMSLLNPFENYLLS